uniref:DNA-directed DNA polymerase n=1 Tax=Chromera velia CCMP2878 TaxID=1169474 RepID=A0A0G4HSL9_9ALVE|eukprot:Cvel_8318.t1-p1 / transcript=Cvel_8318.t1 / gene=Cvel_8318 / organism=Chromera_velia_CCMP2878 / gene_product=DNA polymerase epsilon catalytic subunit A, putative / transcript_product=DNA polymerase epsilon catalytic subunit A, putative / location=Cvel_scaffold457:8659-30507(+) / protein_length=2582 / sequence_SO=supercontig / SO=protein_coding / is_pseudo=false
MSKLAGRVDKGGIFQSRSLFLYRVTGEEGVGAKRGEGDVISLFRAQLLTALFKKVFPDSSLRSFDTTKNDLSACMRMVPRGGILGGGRATFDLNVKRMCELNGWGWDDGAKDDNAKYKKKDRGQSTYIEDLFGVEIHSDESERTGFLFNFKATAITVDSNEEAAMWLFFVQSDGQVFRTAFKYRPYFYVAVPDQEEKVRLVEQHIKSKFGNTLHEIEVVKREDLKLPDHLSGVKRTLMKLSFLNVNDLREVRAGLRPLAEANKKSLKHKDLEALLQTAIHAQARSLESAPNWVLDLYEDDVIYTARVCIDCDIRCGLWYDVKRSALGEVQLNVRSDLKLKPNLRCFAWDIETTKERLKFPDPSHDEIMMISYMFEGDGYLIVNREIVSADIEDFSYSPKPEYSGEFKVFNEADEGALLRRFFSHIRELRPLIFVSFNGDLFDFPFVHTRAETHGMKMYLEMGVNSDNNGVFSGRISTHMDCFAWVQRDSYLPQGSQGLKAVTKAKLKYDPVELDPELMQPYAESRPQELANYSVSDAVATYFIYKKFIHDFVFALATIIPMQTDDVLRKGSGTLCENILMVEAFSKNIVFPNKHKEDALQFHKGNLLESATYEGGKVESLLTGIYRADIPEKFRLDPSAFQMLMDKVDATFDFWCRMEAFVDPEDITNVDEVKEEVRRQLQALRDAPVREEKPLIYHLDVGAMYPNIILSNRLQPPAIVSEDFCTQCSFYPEREKIQCQRRMNWVWRGELFTATRSDYHTIRAQLESERFPLKEGRPGEEQGASGSGGGVVDGSAFHRDRDRQGDRNGQGGGGPGVRDGGKNYRRWGELSEAEQVSELLKRVKLFGMKAYRKTKRSETELRTETVCQRENPFYVATVKDFKERRYEHKKSVKVWKKHLETAEADGNAEKIVEAKNMGLLYDSLQLAHKCILNSFYGYVMRKGARWHSMEMAGIVTHTGANIIESSRELVERVGRPLELDTDGIWCILPESFPEDFFPVTKGGKKLKWEYPCSMLNIEVHERFTNHQYQTLDPMTGEYTQSSENSIFFEIDGPYKAMVLPASQDEDRLLKKRYAVFNFDGSLAELKGFEIKRRGELQLVKVFQEEVFPAFLQGDSLDGVYQAVGAVANKWLDVLDTQGENLTDEEIVDLISESKTMSKSVAEAGATKSMGITTAKRMAEFLGEGLLRDRNLRTHFVVTERPVGAPVCDRAVPVQIFAAEERQKAHFLKKWTKEVGAVDTDIRDILDWGYYKQRLTAAILKIIAIPAAFQHIRNPVPRVALPDWLARRVQAESEKHKQRKVTQYFQRVEKPKDQPLPKTAAVADIEDMEKGLPPGLAAAKKRGVGQMLRADEPTPSTTASNTPAAMNAGPPVKLKENPTLWLKQQREKWKALRDAIAAERKNRPAAQQEVSRQLQVKGVKRQVSALSRVVRRFGGLNASVSPDAFLASPLHILSIIPDGDVPGLFTLWVAVEVTGECLRLQVRKRRRVVLLCSEEQTEGEMRLPGALPGRKGSVFVRRCQRELPRGVASMGPLSSEDTEGLGDGFGGSGEKEKGYIQRSRELLRARTGASGAGVRETNEPKSRHLYELELDESEFQRQAEEGLGYFGLAGVLREVLAVYESQVPLWVQLFAELGPSVSVRLPLLKEEAELESGILSEQVLKSEAPGRFLDSTPEVFFLHISFNAQMRRFFAALFLCRSERAYVLSAALNPNDRKDIPAQKLFAEAVPPLFAARDEEGNLRWTVSAAVQKSVDQCMNALRALVRENARSLVGSAGGGVLAVQSCLDDAALGPELCTPGCMPVIRLHPHAEDSVFPALDWQRWSARRVAVRFRQSVELLAARLRLCRVARVPPGCLPSEETQVASTVWDLTVSRKLRMMNMVSWGSASPAPGVGGSVPVHLSANVQSCGGFLDEPMLNEGSEAERLRAAGDLLELERQRAVPESWKDPMMVWPGTYRAVCAEFPVARCLALTAVREARKIAEQNGSIDFLLDVKVGGKGNRDQTLKSVGVQPVRTKGDGEKENRGGDQNTASSSGTQTQATEEAGRLGSVLALTPSAANFDVTCRSLTVLRNVIDEVEKSFATVRRKEKNRVGPGEGDDGAEIQRLFDSFHDWVASPDSLLHDPALHRKVNDYTTSLLKMICHMIKTMGGQPVAASFRRVCFCTQRLRLVDAQGFLERLRARVEQSDVLGMLDIQIERIFACGTWVDPWNWVALPFREDGTPDQRPVWYWKMAEFLPPAVMNAFVAFTGEFVFRPFWKSLHILKEDPRMSDRDLEARVTAFAKEDFNEVIRRKVLERVSGMSHERNNELAELKDEDLLSDEEDDEDDISDMSVDEEDDGDGDSEMDDFIERDEEDTAARVREKRMRSRRKKKQSKAKRLQWIEQKKKQWAFPEVPGGYQNLELSSAELEFSKQVTKVFALDKTMEDEVQTLYRNLLLLCHVGTFSSDAEWKNPCKSVILRSMRCESCGGVCDLNVTGELSDVDEQMEVWRCPSCAEEFSRTAVESRLVALLESVFALFFSQDLVCLKCKTPQRAQMQTHCKCTGAYRGRIGESHLRLLMRVLGDISENQELAWLRESVDSYRTMVA